MQQEERIRTTHTYLIMKSFIEMVSKLEKFGCIDSTNFKEIFNRLDALDRLSLIGKSENYERCLAFICDEGFSDGREKFKECKLCSQKINITYPNTSLILLHCYCHHPIVIHEILFELKEKGQFNFDQLYK